MAGPFYFAWADAGTAFDPEAHAIEDESIFAFDLSQDEGEFAKLSLTIRNPRAGLLAPGRKVWAWLSFFDGSSIVPLFFGRLIGIPTSVFEDVCTLEFIARPADYKAQKDTLAESLRVLPYYDPIFIAKDRRTDPDVVLEAYSALYHTDRFAGPITISDVLSGEDGTLEFGEGEILKDGLELNLNNIPLRSVRMQATVAWDQAVNGSVDLTEYICAHWPNIEPGKRYISSYTPDGLVGGWPSGHGGTKVGNGWEGAKGECSCKLLTSYDTKTFSAQESSSTKWETNGVLGNLFNDDGDEVTSQSSVNITALPENIERWKLAYQLGLPAGAVVTDQDNKSSYDDEHNLTATSWSVSAIRLLFPLGKMQQAFAVTYDHSRAAKEVLTFQLDANVQPVVTEPGEDEVLELVLSSEKVSDPLDDSVPAEEQIVPVGEARSNTYFGLPRGQQSIEYCILLARAHLAARSRVVGITVGVTNIVKALGVSLRKNATITDPRLPGGAATGKVIGYQFALDGDSGEFNASIKIGCSVGYGGSVSAIEGSPGYADDYTTDYDELVGQQNALPLGDVGYIVPNIAASQNLLGTLSWRDVVVSFSVENGPAVQKAAMDSAVIAQIVPSGGSASTNTAQVLIDAREKAVLAALEQVPTIMRLTLVPLSQELGMAIDLEVTELELPQSINLEAVA